MRLDDGIHYRVIPIITLLIDEQYDALFSLIHKDTNGLNWCLLTSNKRENFRPESFPWFTALTIMEVLKTMSSDAHASFVCMPICRICPSSGQHHQRATVSISRVVSLKTIEDMWTKLCVSVHRRRRIQLMWPFLVVGEDRLLLFFALTTFPKMFGAIYRVTSNDGPSLTSHVLNQFAEHGKWA